MEQNYRCLFLLKKINDERDHFFYKPIVFLVITFNLLFIRVDAQKKPVHHSF